MIPPRRNPITSGDCSAAADIVPPICTRVASTNGVAPIAINLARGAISKVPNIKFNPSGNFFSIIGIINPTI